MLESMRDKLNEILIVSQAEVRAVSGSKLKKPEEANMKVTIETASGEKCQRCWNYSETVGRDSRFQDVCERCVEVLEAGGR